MPEKVKRYRRTDAAKYLTDEQGLPCSPKTLAKLACVGGGPKFQMFGRFPVYPEPELDRYADSKLSPLVSSTSELAALKTKPLTAPKSDSTARAK